MTLRSVPAGTFEPTAEDAAAAAPPITAATLSLRQAIFFTEHPFAISRDIAPAEIPGVMDAMDRLFVEARESRPLEWQAYEARCRRWPLVGITELTRTVAAKLGSGAPLPDDPPAPAS